MEGRGSAECGLRKPKREYREPKLINSEMAVEWENVRLCSLNRKKNVAGAARGHSGRFRTAQLQISDFRSQIAGAAGAPGVLRTATTGKCKMHDRRITALDFRRCDDCKCGGVGGRAEIPWHHGLG